MACLIIAVTIVIAIAWILFAEYSGMLAGWWRRRRDRMKDEIL